MLPYLTILLKSSPSNQINHSLTTQTTQTIFLPQTPNQTKSINMKFAAALFAAGASAATFSVSDFSAGCIRHSTQCL